MKRILISLALLIAPAAFAQTAEFGRASADTSLDMTTKQSRLFSGSFSMSTGRGFGAAVGGTAVKDRVWFFASGEQSRSTLRTSTAGTNLNMSLPKDFLSLHSTSVLSPGSFVTVDVSQSRH